MIESNKQRLSPFSIGDYYWFIISSALIAILAFYPLFSILYTHDDDVGVHFTVSWDAFADRFENIQRLQQILPLNLVPYLHDSFFYHRFTSLLPIFSAVLLLGVVVHAGTKSIALGFLASILFCLFAQNSLQFNVLSSNHFALSIGFVFILVAIFFFLRFLDGGRRRLVWLAASSFTLSCLLYELNLFYVLVFALLSLGKRRSLRRSCGDIWPFALLLCGYLIAYSGANYFNPIDLSNYGGTTVEWNFDAFFKTLYQLSISAFPSYFFFNSDPHLYNSIAQDFTTFRPTLGFVLLNARPEWFVQWVLAVAVILCLLHRLDFTFSLRGFLAALLGSSALIFLPNVLLALTAKYQLCVVSYGFKSYTGTTYSTFGFVLLFLTLSVALLQRSGTGLSRYLVIGTLAIGFGTLGLFNSYHNHQIGAHQTKYRYLWSLTDLYFRSPEFLEIPEGSTVFAPSLWSTLVSVPNRPGYWTDQAFFKSGRKVTFTNNPELFSQATGQKFFMKYSQEEKDFDQSLIVAAVSAVDYLAKTSAERSYVYSDRLLIFSLSPNRRYTVALRFDRDKVAPVLLGGVEVERARRSASIVVDVSGQAGKATTAYIDSPRIDVDATLISGVVNTPDCPGKRCP